MLKQYIQLDFLWGDCVWGRGRGEYPYINLQKGRTGISGKPENPRLEISNLDSGHSLPMQPMKPLTKLCRLKANLSFHLTCRLSQIVRN